MSAISVTWFRTPWKAGLEFLLWSALTGANQGMAWSITPEEIETLREHSERCRGWIVAKGMRPGAFHALSASIAGEGVLPVG